MSTLARLIDPLAREGDPILIHSKVEASDGYRHSLEYIWDIGSPVLPWIMLNPAEAGTLREFDMTARRVIRYSYRWGFGRALLLNIVPFISPSPAALCKWLEEAKNGSGGASVAFDNWMMIGRRLADHDAAMVAWGTGNPIKPDLFKVLTDNVLHTITNPFIEHVPFQPFCLGLTADGHPLHPMARGKHRVSDTARPILYPHQHGSISGLGEAVA